MTYFPVADCDTRGTLHICSTSEGIESKKEIYCLRITYNKAIIYKQHLDYLNIQWERNTKGFCWSVILYYQKKFCTVAVPIDL